jgi:hypothetical protein
MPRRRGRVDRLLRKAGRVRQAARKVPAMKEICAIAELVAPLVQKLPATDFIRLAKSELAAPFYRDPHLAETPCESIFALRQQAAFLRYDKKNCDLMHQPLVLA